MSAMYGAIVQHFDERTHIFILIALLANATLTAWIAIEKLLGIDEKDL